MCTPTQVLMPLRSNAAWFTRAELRTTLERQIKLNLLLFDQVLFENGRFHLAAGVDGQGMQMKWRHDSFPGDRGAWSYYEPGSEFGVQIGGNQLLSSQTETAHDVDYLPLIRDAGIEDAHFIRWSNHELSDSVMEGIKKRVNADLAIKELHEVLPQNSFLKKHMLLGLYQDAFLAQSLNLPFSVDHLIRPVVQLKQEAAEREWSSSLPESVFQCWLNLELPDFTSEPWDKVCEIRESEAGISFRQMVHRVSGRAAEMVAQCAEQRDVDALVAHEFSREMLEELASRVKTPLKVGASMCLNLLPFSAVIGGVSETLALHRDQTSWISFAGGYKAG